MPGLNVASGGSSYNRGRFRRLCDFVPRFLGVSKTQSLTQRFGWNQQACPGSKPTASALNWHLSKFMSRADACNLCLVSSRRHRATHERQTGRTEIKAGQTRAHGDVRSMLAEWSQAKPSAGDSSIPCVFWGLPFPDMDLSFFPTGPRQHKTGSAYFQQEPKSAITTLWHVRPLIASQPDTNYCSLAICWQPYMGMLAGHPKKVPPSVHPIRPGPASEPDPQSDCVSRQLHYLGVAVFFPRKHNWGPAAVLVFGSIYHLVPFWYIELPRQFHEFHR